MIWYVILNAIVSLVNVIFGWIPKVTDLPFGIGSTILSVTAAWNTFLELYAWPLVNPWHFTLWYFTLVVGLMVLRLLRIIR